MNLNELSLEELHELRKKTEISVSRYKTLQEAVKVTLNSAYGIMGNKFFMFFDKRTAEAVTITGQGVIKWISARLNEYLNRLLKTTDKDYVKLIDTDSVTLWMKPVLDTVFNRPYTDTEACDFLSKMFNEKIIPFVNRQYDELAKILNANENVLSLKIDTITSKAIYLTKKRYIYWVLETEGVRLAEPDLKMMGIETVRSSTPQFIRDKLTECIKILLLKTQKDVNAFIKTTKDEFLKLPVQQIASPRSVNDIEKYTDGATHKKGAPIQVKAGIVYNNLLKKASIDHKYQSIRSGDKIKFIKLKTPNPIGSDVIGFKDTIPEELETMFQLKRYYEYNQQFEDTFLNPIEKILNEANMMLVHQDNLFYL